MMTTTNNDEINTTTTTTTTVLLSCDGDEFDDDKLDIYEDRLGDYVRNKKLSQLLKTGTKRKRKRKPSIFTGTRTTGSGLSKKKRRKSKKVSKLRTKNLILVCCDYAERLSTNTNNKKTLSKTWLEKFIYLYLVYCDDIKRIQYQYHPYGMLSENFTESLSELCELRLIIHDYTTNKISLKHPNCDEILEAIKSYFKAEIENYFIPFISKLVKFEFTDLELTMVSKIWYYTTVKNRTFDSQLFNELVGIFEPLSVEEKKSLMPRVELFINEILLQPKV